MVSANNAINDTVGASISGVTNTLTVTNASNTASSAARETIVVGGGTAGDPTINWNVSGVTNWEMGIDNSDSDKLKISQGTALGTNDVWKMTTSGERNLPLQPAFLAYLGTSKTNATGNGTAFTFGDTSISVALTEVYDQGGDFTPGSLTGAFFTAPVDGIYNFGCSCWVGNLGAGFTNLDFGFQTTLGGYSTMKFSPGKTFTSSGDSVYTGSCNALMHAGDTCFFGITIFGGTKTVTINANSPGVINNTACWGGLLW